MEIVSAGPMLSDPLVADDARIMASPPAWPEDAKHNRNEEDPAADQPPRLHGVMAPDYRPAAQLDMAWYSVLCG